MLIVADLVRTGFGVIGLPAVALVLLALGALGVIAARFGWRAEPEKNRRRVLPRGQRRP